MIEVWLGVTVHLNTTICISIGSGVCMSLLPDVQQHSKLLYRLFASMGFNAFC